MQFEFDQNHVSAAFQVKNSENKAIVVLTRDSRFHIIKQTAALSADFVFAVVNHFGDYFDASEGVDENIKLDINCRPNGFRDFFFYRLVELVPGVKERKVNGLIKIDERGSLARNVNVHQSLVPAMAELLDEQNLNNPCFNDIEAKQIFEGYKSFANLNLDYADTE